MKPIKTQFTLVVLSAFLLVYIQIAVAFTEKEVSEMTAENIDKADLITSGTTETSLNTENKAEAPPEALATSTISSKEEKQADTGVWLVPFYSQFSDISRPEWRGQSCGIAALSMLIDHYQDPVLPDVLLDRGINNGAYIYDAGWSHQGLINLAIEEGMTGYTNVMHSLGMDEAFSELKAEVKEGPVIVSVHYTFVPTNPIPHLVVVTGIHNGEVYYNDPADPEGNHSISVEQFKSAWKKRYIAIRPLNE